jgi:error-prone DNA polymerase
MPERPDEKIRPVLPPSAERLPRGDYAELHVTSNFSFLRGASHPEELVGQALNAGCFAVAVTDINTLAGVVRGHGQAKALGMPYLVGCHLQVKAATGVLAVGTPEAPPPLSVLVYPTDRASYGRLCRLLTLGKRRAAKGACDLTLQDVLDHQAGMLAIAVAPPLPGEGFDEAVRILKEAFDGDRLSLAVTRLYGPHDQAQFGYLENLGRRLGVPLVATNDVHYHVPERRALQEVLTCIRLGCTRQEAGFHLFANAERHIKGPAEMARLFARHPDAIVRTRAIAERAMGFSLDQLHYEYPAEVCPPGKSMMEHLVELTWKGAHERYPDGIPEGVRNRLQHEFNLIDQLKYPAYFLTVHDIVTFARSRGILCQGRGAAANSAVCYCLGITAVDPGRIDLLVERFISVERNEPPDIDIDFEHERREEVIQYLYSKYGRERAALTAEVITYRRRSAIREVGKALGLSLDCVDRLAKAGDWWDKGIIDAPRLRELGIDAADATLREAVALAGELLGFPRHLSQHVGGFVITAGPLCESVPIENAAMPDRTTIEWDKDDIDALGMLKVDILGLGMLTAVRKTLDLINDWDRRQGGPGNLQFHTIPKEDPAVYDMLCKADSIGVFQVESRAQMTMLPRLKPRCYYDLVIEVAIVRPGPIVGNMVHPYLRRRNRQEEVTYPDDRIRKVLERTLGVPLFQEQAMKMAIVAAGFTPGQADQLRRAMAAWKRKGELIHRLGEKIVAGMLRNGYTHAYALRVFEQIKGFGEYGFPESHAASFALIVYVSAWLKCHHPAAFCAAILNSQPMGFYQPAQLVRDAQNHGVDVRPIDVNHSGWECLLEGDEGKPAVRLGMRLVRGLRKSDAMLLADAVAAGGPFPTLPALWRHARQVRRQSLVALAEADAFGSMGLTRQTALWAVRKLRDERLPLFDGTEVDEVSPGLPAVARDRLVVHDYAATGLSLKAHPLCFVRERLAAKRVTPCGELADERRWRHGQQIAVAGLVLIRQRPGTASGVLFITIEDETGVANLVVRPDVYERHRRAIRHSVAIVAWGRVERQGQVVHVLLRTARNLAEFVQAEEVTTRSRDFR